MMEDINEDIKNLRVRLDEASRYLQIPELLKRRELLEEEMADPNLWDDQKYHTKYLGGQISHTFWHR